MEIKKIPLASNQYYQGTFKKNRIFLHHTAGGSAASAIAWWGQTPQRIATPYVIERNGEVYECYDPKYWAYHLGIKGVSADIEKTSIGIEIVSFGNLTKKAGKYYAWTGREVPAEEVINLDPAFRNVTYFHKYTDAQIKALSELLPILMERFGIKVQPLEDMSSMVRFVNPSKLPAGIWSHSTVRSDKVDIYPSKPIFDLLTSLKK